MIPEHYVLLNASGNELSDFVVAGSQQPSEIEWHSILSHSHPADSLVDLLLPANSFPANAFIYQVKTNTCICQMTNKIHSEPHMVKDILNGR